MFRPPRCPHRDCPRHRDLRPDFCRPHGSYRPRCRPRPVPRFRCRTCGRTFSRQTFRADYHDHRPHLNAPLVRLLASGVGLRQSSRLLGLSRRCTELKFRKLARHLRRLNLNLRTQLPDDVVLQFDELETYESRRNTRPLSVPILIERRSRFVLWAEAAPIRPRGKMTPARVRAIREDEARFGRRKDLSGRSVDRTLRRGGELVRDQARIVFESDEKASYPAHARRVFGASRLEHRTTNSKLARRTWNPLFPVNHTEAMLRDLTGRLRRESWLVSKKRRYLDLGLQLWIAFRNLVRRRFNGDEESPAQLLCFVERRLRWGEVLSWRQDWGTQSIHPQSRRGASIATRLGRGTA